MPRFAHTPPSSESMRRWEEEVQREAIRANGMAPELGKATQAVYTVS